MTGRETAERRQVTILNADIVNSTSLVDHLDPEEVMGIMQKYLDLCKAIVAQFHGVLAGYTGDGFEAYFGYPVAREDSAVEALNAAIQVARFSAERDSQLPLGCRIGIATGRVVVAQPGIHGVGRNVMAFGAAPTLAARLEQMANPGRILLDHATMELCEGRFAFHCIGSVHLKGFDDDYEVWEVVEPMRPGRRFIQSGLSPFVGRNAEVQLLVSRWRSVLAGHGQVVVLHGEPGMGKSRLVHEVQRSLPGGSGSIFQFQCLNHFSSTPLHPWIHSVQRFANILQSDDADEKLAKIRRYLGDKLGFPEDVVRNCANLMGLAPTDAVHYVGQSPQHMTRLQEVLVGDLIAASRRTPLFVLVEDMQWIDASTMNLLQSLIEVAGTERIFLVMTCRSGGGPLFNAAHVTSLSLVKLDSVAVTALIAKLTSSSRQPLSETVTERIRQKSDGNPLFVEELTKHYVEMATSNRPDAAIAEQDPVPKLLQGSLMERIDKAGTGKEIAQLASVVGEDFDEDILVDLSESDREIVRQQLDALAELRIVERSPHSTRVSYQFCHALLRDAVYSSLLKPTRRRTHQRIAEYFAGDRGAAKTVPSEIIAYHYGRSGDHGNAFRYWLGAGQHALRAGATAEAAALFEKALKAAEAIGETPDKPEDMAILCLSYGFALNASRGVGASPMDYFRKAEELSTQIGNTDLTLEALDWQFGLHFNAGQLLASKAPALKMKQLGSSLNHRTAIASGCQGLGMAEFVLGNFLEARKEFEFGLEAGGHHVSGAHCYPSMTLSYLAWTLLALGHASEAEACADRAIESARQESSHALATALNNCCYVYQCMALTGKVYERTEELVEHTKKHGEQMYLRRGNIIRGWADCMAYGGDQPIQHIADEIQFLLRSKEEIEITYLLGVLADLQISHGRFADAHSSLNKALEIANKNQEHFYLSEIYRLKAKLAEVDPTRSSPSDAESHLAAARRIAEAQHAKAWLDRLSSHRLH